MKDFKFEFTEEQKETIRKKLCHDDIHDIIDYLEVVCADAIQARADADGWVKVEVLQDESSHWYVIPCSLRSEWDAHEQKIQNCDEYSDEWYEAIAAFSAKFSAYMTGGNINDTQLYIQLPPKQ